MTMRSFFFLIVLSLFLYINFVESCNSVRASLLGKRFRFQSKNFPKRYFRHRGLQMWLDPYSASGLYKLDSSFDIVPGLAGVGVSFRSVNFPNYFIRHSGFKCYIHRSDGKPLFRNDATFIPRVGLADSRGVSFESVNFPGFFIRHRGFRVRIDRIDGSQLFRLDATWFPKIIKGFLASSQWLLVDGDHYSHRHIDFYKMEGLEVGKRYSTSYGINTENSWEDAIEEGTFASIGCSIKAMFRRFKSARVTGASSWTKLSKRGVTSISIVKPTFLWQLYLCGLTSEGTLIISKTNLYRQTSSNNPPPPVLSSQTGNDQPESNALDGSFGDDNPALDGSFEEDGDGMLDTILEGYFNEDKEDNKDILDNAVPKDGGIAVAKDEKFAVAKDE